MRLRSTAGVTRAVAAAALLLILSLYAGCAGTPARPSTNTPPPAGPGANPPPAGPGDRAATFSEIAYVAADGGIRTVNRDGSGDFPVTPRTAAATETDVRFGMPAWSPDGRHLAYVRFEGGTDGLQADIRMVSENGRPPHTMVENAVVSPQYLAWLPGGARLGYVGARPGSSELELHTVAPVTGDSLGGSGRAGGGSGEPLLVGRPLHWDVCPDGTPIVAHVDGTRPYGGRVSVLSAADPESLVIENDPSLFRAPDCAPDGESALVAARGGHIVSVSLDAGARRIVTEYEGRTVFSYDPTGRRLAYIEGTMTRFGGVRGALSVVERPGGEGQRVEAFDGAPSVTAFFWSTDGTRLAYFQPAFDGNVASEFLVSCTVMDFVTGESATIGPLRLSPVFAQEVLLRFDQFARAATIWSPDDSALALGLIDAGGTPAVYVIPVDGADAAPRRVASGDLPMWRPGGVNRPGRIAWWRLFRRHPYLYVRVS